MFEITQEALDRIKKLKELLDERIIGQDEMKQAILKAVVSYKMGKPLHLLLIGPPGVGKTMATRCIEEAGLNLRVGEVYGTNDLAPEDLIGDWSYWSLQLDRKKPSIETFSEGYFNPGPLLTSDVLLIQEINRVPPRTLNTIIEVMSDQTVTIKPTGHKIKKKILVIATMNPYDPVGTYDLPKAIVDRFDLVVHVEYPSKDEEIEIARKYAEKWAEIPPELEEAIVEIVSETRVLPEYIKIPAGPRATLTLMSSATLNAMLEGRNVVTEDDIRRSAVGALVHRIEITPRAKSVFGGDEIRAKIKLIQKIVEDVLARIRMKYGLQKGVGPGASGSPPDDRWRGQGGESARSVRDFARDPSRGLMMKIDNIEEIFKDYWTYGDYYRTYTALNKTSNFRIEGRTPEGERIEFSIDQARMKKYGDLQRGDIVRITGDFELISEFDRNGSLRHRLLPRRSWDYVNIEKIDHDLSSAIRSSKKTPFGIDIEDVDEELAKAVFALAPLLGDPAWKKSFREALEYMNIKEETDEILKRLEKEGVLKRDYDSLKLTEEGYRLLQLSIYMEGFKALSDYAVSGHHVGKRGRTGIFEGYREYKSGDPFRLLDARQTIKRTAGKPYMDPRDWVCKDFKDTGRIDVMLVLDRSSSMSRYARIHRALKAAAALAHAAEDCGDRVGLITFNHNVDVLCDLSNSALDVISKLGEIRPDGSTCIYGALYLAGEITPKDGHIILITDGEPTDCVNRDWRRKNKESSILELAEDMAKERKSISVVAITENRTFLEFLNDLARRANGRCYVVSDSEDLHGVVLRDYETARYQRLAL